MGKGGRPRGRRDMDNTVRKRIMRHLEKWRGMETLADGTAPYALTCAGISEAIGVKAELVALTLTMMKGYGDSLKREVRFVLLPERAKTNLNRGGVVGTIVVRAIHRWAEPAKPILKGVKKRCPRCLQPLEAGFECGCMNR